MDVSLYFSCERFIRLFIYELVFIYIYSVCAPAKINAFPPFLPPFSHISLLWIIKWLLPEFNLEATHSWAFLIPLDLWRPRSQMGLSQSEGRGRQPRAGENERREKRQKEVEKAGLQPVTPHTFIGCH